MRMRRRINYRTAPGRMYIMCVACASYYECVLVMAMVEIPVNGMRERVRVSLNARPPSFVGNKLNSIVSSSCYCGSKYNKRNSRGNGRISLPAVVPTTRHREPPKPPCSTAVMHFCAYPSARPARKEIRSATRRNNPHPVGLAFQSPYNQHSQVCV